MRYEGRREGPREERKEEEGNELYLQTNILWGDFLVLPLGHISLRWSKNLCNNIQCEVTDPPYNNHLSTSWRTKTSALTKDTIHKWPEPWILVYAQIFYGTISMAHLQYMYISSHTILYNRVFFLEGSNFIGSDDIREYEIDWHTCTWSNIFYRSGVWQHRQNAKLTFTKMLLCETYM